jgi:hypothetical protein
VELARVDRQPLCRELVADRRVAERVHAHADRRLRALPTGPAKTPVCSDDARTAPSSSGHHGCWSASISNRRWPSPSA